ncbi:MAG: D-2-hydroxyacid dehydrogenase [Bacilli bacterium]|nr:D-2-hydroxyacid dehydrogenase [Bacilli bacterium]MBN2697089.1 D-2-hydroxyacid dehydrogenase [Bacilli bacterium]
MKVYIDKRIIGAENVSCLMQDFSDIKFVTEPGEALEAEICFVMPNFFTHQNLNDYTKLKFVQLLMAGYDKFDIDTANRLGIKVANAQDIFSITVAEDVFTKIFVLNRNARHYLESMKTRTWKPIRKEPELTGSVVGILGTGSIGKELAKRFKSFSATVYGYGRKIKDLPDFDRVFNDRKGLEFIVSNSDYVILALPLTEATYHLVDEKLLGMMKSSALLINVARGEIVDQDALEQALIEKRIRGAGIDVTTPEPLPSSSKLWELENVYLTPHNASSSPHMQSRLTELVRMNLNNYLQDKEILYLIN